MRRRLGAVISQATISLDEGKSRYYFRQELKVERASVTSTSGIACSEQIPENRA